MAINRRIDIARLMALGTQEHFAQSAIEEATGSPYGETLPDVQEDLRRPGDPGLNLDQFQNPYRTVMYSVVGLDTAIPTRALPGNSKRCYLLVQNLGPGNLFLGIGVDPNVGGGNVLNLITTQVYEQIGGGTLMPDGTTWMSAFVSSEYISLLTDTSGTAAMILEGSYSPQYAQYQFR